MVSLPGAPFGYVCQLLQPPCHFSADIFHKYKLKSHYQFFDLLVFIFNKGSPQGSKIFEQDIGYNSINFTLFTCIISAETAFPRKVA